MPALPSIQPRALAFVSMVDSTAGRDGCWPWRGHVNRKGYGQFQAGGGVVHAHRWSYEFFIGPIPNGLHVDHLCRVRNCVNPRHLEAVTNAENQRRGLINQNAQKTHCPKGHEYESYTTKSGKTWRRCRPCWNEYRRNWRMRNKLAGRSRADRDRAA